MKLTGAAILVSRGVKILQAAPAAYPYRSAVEQWMTPDTVLSRLVALFPGFAAYWGDPGNSHQPPPRVS